MDHSPLFSSLFFFNDTATTEIYTLSYTTLFRSQRLPIFRTRKATSTIRTDCGRFTIMNSWTIQLRSEEHTSELQSHLNLVCRLLLEKKKYLDYYTYLFYSVRSSDCSTFH